MRPTRRVEKEEIPLGAEKRRKRLPLKSVQRRFLAISYILLISLNVNFNAKR